MISEAREILSRELSGEMIQEHIRQIGRFYRSPGSAGYHAAIDYVIDRLQQNDIQFTVHEYPLDGVSKVRGERTPLAWEPQGGVLEMVSPTSQTLVRWEECASCLPWWCPATPPGGIDLELVDVGTGTDDEAYLGREVQGKAVLVHDAKENFAWSDIVARAKRHNVAGLITNYLLYQYAPWRTRATLPEAVQQLRLPSVRENPWTFTVSQPAFECLETALAQGAVKPVVRFSVSARTFEGTSRSVLATIPGEIAGESIVFVSHVSAATMPGANCASGVAVLIELARGLTARFAAGELPRPRRSIHFLFANEGYGSLHLAEEHPAVHQGAVAAIALCSVGHDQGLTKSSLVVGRSPDALPTFVNDLVETLTLETREELPWAYRPGTKDIAYVRWSVQPYTPWSDNTTWAQLGVPSLLLMSLPDRYFHTQLLTADKTDPQVLARSGVLLGTVAVLVACSGWQEASVLMRLVVARSEERMSQFALRALDKAGQTSLETAMDALQYMADRDVGSVRSVLRVVPAEASQTAEKLARSLEQLLLAKARSWVELLKQHAAPIGDSGDSASSWPVVVRTGSVGRPHGVPGFDYAQALQLLEEMSQHDGNIVAESLHVLIDGLWYATRRPTDVATISRALCHEFGLRVEPEHIQRLAEGLERAGFVKLADEATNESERRQP